MTNSTNISSAYNPEVPHQRAIMSSEIVNLRSYGPNGGHAHTHVRLPAYLSKQRSHCTGSAVRRQGNFIYVAQFRHKVTQSALQGHEIH